MYNNVQSTSRVVKYSQRWLQKMSRTFWYLKKKILPSNLTAINISWGCNFLIMRNNLDKRTKRHIYNSELTSDGRFLHTVNLRYLNKGNFYKHNLYIVTTIIHRCQRHHKSICETFNDKLINKCSQSIK